MARELITRFEAGIPVKTPRELTQFQAQAAENVDLSRGSLRPLYALGDVLTLTALTDLLTIARVVSGVNSFWFTSQQVAALVMAPVEDGGGRFYYADGVRPRVSDYSLASNAGAKTFGSPDRSYYLGMPKPSSAPVATLLGSGNGTLLETGIAYVYTWVNAWGWESLPSDPSGNLDIEEEQTVQLTGFELPPPSHYNITGIRIYRTNTGTDGSGELELVSELLNAGSAGLEYTRITTVALAAGTGTIAISGTTVTGIGTQFISDGLSDGDIILVCGQYFKLSGDPASETSATVTVAAIPAIAAGETFTWGPPVSYIDDSVGGIPAQITASLDLGEVIATEEYDEPPSALKGLLLLDNQVFAGYDGNTLYLSEPTVDYAYPQRYEVKTDYPIVALGHFGNNAVVATQAYPYLIDCYDPAAPGRNRIPQKQACLFGQGLVSGPYYVEFPTPDGLFRISADGAGISTELLFDKKLWRALLSSNLSAPATTYDKTLVSFYYENRYIAFFRGTADGFIIESGPDGERRFATFALPTGNAVYGGYVDALTDTLYLLIKIGSVYYIKSWEGNLSGTLAYRFLSKLFSYPTEMSFSCARATGSFSAGAAGTGTVATSGTTLTGSGTAFLTELSARRFIKCGNRYREIAAVTSNTAATLVTAFDANIAAGTAFTVFTTGLNVYVDGVLRFVRALFDNRPFRLADALGFAWEYEFKGTGEIFDFTAATSMQELSYD